MRVHIGASGGVRGWLLAAAALATWVGGPGAEAQGPAADEAGRHTGQTAGEARRHEGASPDVAAGYVVVLDVWADQGSGRRLTPLEDPEWVARLAGLLSRRLRAPVEVVRVEDLDPSVGRCARSLSPSVVTEPFAWARCMRERLAREGRSGTPLFLRLRMGRRCRRRMIRGREAIAMYQVYTWTLGTEQEEQVARTFRSASMMGRRGRPLLDRVERVTVRHVARSVRRWRLRPDGGGP